MNKQLANIQSELKALSSDALAVGDPTLFKAQQSVSSSDTTRVQASSATGAGVGGYQVAVTQIANSAQANFSYASPASEDQVTVGGDPYTIKAAESIQDFVDSINADTDGTVYAAATNSGTVVFSSRQTGASSSVAVSDGGHALAPQSSKPGQDAQFSVDGVSGTSPSNTVTNAIGGVTRWTWTRASCRRGFSRSTPSPCRTCARRAWTRTRRRSSRSTTSWASCASRGRPIADQPVDER